MSFGDETFVYDAMGNPTTYRGMTCTWEKGRQLKSMTSAAGTATFTYDGTGLRKSKTVGNETTSYVYENGRLLRQTGSETVNFIYGSEGVIGFKVGTASYLYRKNLFGDVTEIYNEAGTIVGKYSYTAFGVCTVELDTNGIATKNPIRYRSYYYDDETELYYLKSRYYDPEVGRFITIDDLSYLDPESINGLNLYAYCGNNPVMRVDPNGNWDWDRFWSALAILAVVGIAITVTILTGGMGSIVAMAVLTGTVAAGANAFGQVVFGGKNLATLDWIDVGITFVAAGLSALVPGSGFSSILAQSSISAGVENIGNAILGRKEFSFGSFLVDVISGVALGYAMKGISSAMRKEADKIFLKGKYNYSSWQHYFRQQGFDYTREEVYKEWDNIWQKELKFLRYSEQIISFLISIIISGIRSVL